jgi:hypothetical protein
VALVDDDNGRVRMSKNAALRDLVVIGAGARARQRALEELVVYGLAERDPQGQGKTDMWRSV